MADAPEVARALDGVLDQLPRRPRRIALLLPDGAAKVSMVRFASVPARATDLDPMIRWQVRKTVPFDVDEAQMDWTPGRSTAGGEQEFVVVLAHRAVVEEYEQVCTAAGVHAGLVDLLSFQPDRCRAAGTAPATSVRTGCSCTLGGDPARSPSCGAGIRCCSGPSRTDSRWETSCTRR